MPYVNTSSSGGNGTTPAESGANAAYVSLSAAEAAEQGDLSVKGYTPFYCTNGSLKLIDTVNAIFAGWTNPSSVNFVDILGFNDPINGNQRPTFRGWPAPGPYRLETTNQGNNNGALRIDIPYTRVQNLRVGANRTDTVAWNCFGIYVNGAANVVIDRCHVRARYTSTGANVGALYGIRNEGASNLVIANTVMDVRETSTGHMAFARGLYNRLTAVTRVYSSFARVHYAGAGANIGFAYEGTSVINGKNLAVLCTGSSPVGFSGVGTLNLRHCASFDATAVGFNCYPNATFSFVNDAAGDFHLKPSDTGARLRGEDLSADPFYPFDYDFEGEPRIGQWDIGPDQVQLLVPFARRY